MPQQGQERPYTAAYKFAKVATRDKFMDLVDMFPPMFTPEVLPSPDDLKAKICFTFTSAPKGQATTFFRHYVDVRQLRNLLWQMRWGQTGDPTRGNSLYGFPEFKGSYDKKHPQWQATSRVMDVQYVTTANGTPLRNGPSYAFKFSYGEGKRQDNGIVTPASGGTGSTSATIMLPIYGNRDMPPMASLFVEQATEYLDARAVAHLVRMGTALDGLGYRAYNDPKEAARLRAVWEELNGRRPEPPPMSPEEQKQGYDALTQGGGAYEQAPYPYGGQNALIPPAGQHTQY